MSEQVRPRDNTSTLLGCYASNNQTTIVVIQDSEEADGDAADDHLQEADDDVIVSPPTDAIVSPPTDGQADAQDGEVVEEEEEEEEEYISRSK